MLLNLCFLWPCALPDLFKALEGPSAKALALKESLEIPPGGVALGLDLLSLIMRGCMDSVYCKGSERN